MRGGGSEGGKVREEGCGCQRREYALKSVGYEVEVREVMVRVGGGGGEDVEELCEKRDTDVRNLTSYWGGKVAGHTYCTRCSQQLVVMSFILNKRKGNFEMTMN